MSTRRRHGLIYPIPGIIGHAVFPRCSPSVHPRSARVSSDHGPDDADGKVPTLPSAVSHIDSGLMHEPSARFCCSASYHRYYESILRYEIRTVVSPYQSTGYRRGLKALETTHTAPRSRRNTETTWQWGDGLAPARSLATLAFLGESRIVAAAWPLIG
jgi:hypothetical protein